MLVKIFVTLQKGVNQYIFIVLFNELYGLLALINELAFKNLGQLILDLATGMMAVLPVAVTHPKEVLVASILALDARHQNVTILVHLHRVRRDIADSRRKSVLRDHILLDVPLSVENFKRIFVIF